MPLPSYDSATLYYFSGTGNAYSVSQWVKQVGETYDVTVNLVNIADVDSAYSPHLPPNSLIGFISPTHGFNFPPIMLRWLWRFPRQRNVKAIIMNTRGGLKIGGVYLPGLSGMAQYFTALLLWTKGITVVGMRPVDLPSNWMSLHPSLSDHTVESMFEKRKTEVINFSHTIFQKGTDYRALLDIVQDVLLTPIAILYYFIGRFFFAKSFIASDECDGCGQCISQCPVEAIKEVDGRPYWTFECESCMQCMTKCPKQAIETAHGFVAGIIVLCNTLVLYGLYRLIDVRVMLPFSSTHWTTSLIMLVFESLVQLGCLFLGYDLMHFTLKLKFFERLVTHTSLTHLPFWGRYQLRKMKFWKAYRFKKARRPAGQ